MPEGHTIHRHARLHRRHLGGREVAVSSPQGRFARGAARLDGRRLENVDAHGKNLFYRWEGGDILHVHLGLVGKFRTHHGDPPPPTPGTRLAMQADGTTVYLAGPMTCELIDPIREEELRDRLGPDPLRADGSGAFAANLGRRAIGVGAALLDQSVVAGIGNVYRAEVLFLEGIHPDVPARSLRGEQVTALWRRLVAELRRGERSGRIVTVEPADVGARRRSALGRGERLYVYKRAGEPCRRCGTAVARWELAGRKIWACPACQPA